MSKRITSLICFFVFMFTAIIGRCGFVSFSNSLKVNDSYNSYSVSIGNLKSNIYDCKGVKINNDSKEYVAVIRPNEKCLSELDKLFNSDEIKEVTKELSKGYPIARTVKSKPNTKYIKIYDKISDSTNSISSDHIINKNCGGLENYLDDDIGSLKVNFSVDALGRLLNGDDGTIINDNYDSADGVVISLNSQVQAYAEKSAETLPKGAVVVLDANTSQVISSVSRGGDYLNRALSPYAVGSVFKLVVSACALENNINPSYTCKSFIKVGDTVFHCQNYHSHGTQNLESALANSCNCYFVNLALTLGKDKLFKTIKDFGFGENYAVYNNWNLKAGECPTLESLTSKGQLALTGFGQGKLTDSPMHFASVVACIANGGVYHSPTLSLDKRKGKRIISQKSAKTLQKYMRYVVSNGTGANADYNNLSAGKTATAQSGIFENKKEILNTWFAGFYPYNNPQYVIVVMRENGVSGSADCCPVFRSLVEMLNKM